MKIEGESFESLRHPPLVETVLCVTLRRPIWSRGEIVRLAGEIVPGVDPDREFQNEKVTCKTGGVPQVETVKTFGGVRFVKNGNLVLSMMNPSPENGTVVFAFSILPPYVSWKDFLEHALPVYRKFRIVAGGDGAIVRIGLRSINRIFSTQEVCRLSDVIRTVPQDIDGLEQSNVHDFVYRDTQYYPERGLYATVCRSNGPTVDGRRSIILDSDVYFLPRATFTDDDFDSLLSGMHELRNKIFFGSVSEACLKEYRS